MGRIPTQGSNVKLEPFEHLIQHIKQSDPMLYEALKRQSKYFTQIETTINNPSPSKFDKATFGLLKPLAIGTALTNYYICRKGGDFIDLVLKNKVAPDSATNSLPTILDVCISKDDGGSWVSLFNTSAKITIPSGSTSTLTVPKNKFQIPSIAVPNLLRIDCVQVAVPNPGSDYEVVLRWE